MGEQEKSRTAKLEGESQSIAKQEKEQQVKVEELEKEKKRLASLANENQRIQNALHVIPEGGDQTILQPLRDELDKLKHEHAKTVAELQNEIEHLQHAVEDANQERKGVQENKSISD